MFDWFKSHHVAFESYSDADNPAGGTYYGLTTGNGSFPRAAALYRRLYATSAAGVG